jgi:hypothetical protein
MMAIVNQSASTGGADVAFQLPDKSRRAYLDLTPFGAGALSRSGALAAWAACG